MRKIALGEAELQALFGVHDENLQFLESELGIEVSARGREVFLDGDPDRVDVAAKILTELAQLLERGHPVDRRDFRTAVRVARDTPEVSLERFFTDTEVQTRRDHVVRPRGPNQKQYIEAIRSYDVVFAVGPAGTGKTYLAMGMAIEAFNRRQVRRIVLARPALEAGEKLGFLPGDMYEKVNPYLRPLYDALYELVDIERAERMLSRGQIEVAPIAFMRGRTLADSFVILDEAQNTTTEQMKMFLTRIGTGSKAVVNGDITQIDLPPGKMSGLVQATRLLRDIEGMAFVSFTEKDVVRHPLVQKIIKAYEREGSGEHSEAVRQAQQALAASEPALGPASTGEEGDASDSGSNGAGAGLTDEEPAEVLTSGGDDHA